MDRAERAASMVLTMRSRILRSLVRKHGRIMWKIVATRQMMVKPSIRNARTVSAAIVFRILPGGAEPADRFPPGLGHFTGARLEMLTGRPGFLDCALGVLSFGLRSAVHTI